MVSFLGSIVVLIVGYFVYGTFVEKVFGINDKNQTPAIACRDGVDYVPMKWKRIFLIQFLNIAGLGPYLELYKGRYLDHQHFYGLCLEQSLRVEYTILLQDIYQ